MVWTSNKIYVSTVSNLILLVFFFGMFYGV